MTNEDHDQLQAIEKGLEHKISNLDHNSRTNSQAIVGLKVASEQFNKTVEEFRRIVTCKADTTTLATLAKHVESQETRLKQLEAKQTMASGRLMLDRDREYVGTFNPDTINADLHITCDALRGRDTIVVNGLTYSLDEGRDEDSDYEDEDEARLKYEVQELKNFIDRAHDAMNDKGIRDAVYHGPDAFRTPSAAARAVFASVLSDLSDLCSSWD